MIRHWSTADDRVDQLLLGWVSVLLRMVSKIVEAAWKDAKVA